MPLRAWTGPLLTVAFTIGALSIAGVPPFNGYVSLGLIHEGVTGRPVVYGLCVLAQVLTVAALARAAYLGFYRRRADHYERMEPLHTGMRVSLVLLGMGCAAFGALPHAVLRHIAGPAASVLLHPKTYAKGVLRGRAGLPRLNVTFDYTKLSDLAATAGEVGAGVLVATWVVRRGQPRVVGFLRSLHTGSVNDDVLLLTLGLVICCGVLVV